MGVDRRIVVASPGSVELGEEPLDPATIVAGEPRTSAGEIASATLADGSTLETGVWSCTPGTVTDVEADETFVVLSGRADIECDGETFAVGPGRRLRAPGRRRDEVDRPREADEGLRAAD